MQKHRSSETSSSVLRPTTPTDIVNQSQRQRIIDAMIESCAEKTYGGTTISDIVSHAHISRTTFYKHFEDKRACFDATIGFCIEQLQGVAAATHAAGDAPGDAARMAVTAVVEALAARPGLAQLLAGDAMVVDPKVIERYRKATVPALEVLWGGGGNVESHTDPRLAFGQAQVLILNQIATGQPERLPELLPELVYLAVSPYGGHEEALRQSRLAGKTETSGTASR
ncbi:MAG TPA: TetR/AcrR family transcriptional regulator [Solirubrobacterales bacterium]|jgi:AcrR family transcriptional regulator|nr:TetR/AcrR family transcriptional regulator [Solirubrobacterales bacterium]